MYENAPFVTDNGILQIPNEIDNSNCMHSGEPEKLCCQLTSPELCLRKDTVLKSLQVRILERKELDNIYMFRF